MKKLYKILIKDPSIQAQFTLLMVTMIIGTCAWLYSCTYTVRPGEIAVVQSPTGVLRAEIRPGYHFAMGKVIMYNRTVKTKTGQRVHLDDDAAKKKFWGDVYERRNDDRRNDEKPTELVDDMNEPIVTIK